MSMGDVGRKVDISRVLRRDFTIPQPQPRFYNNRRRRHQNATRPGLLMSRTVTGITGVSFTGY